MAKCVMDGAPGRFGVAKETKQGQGQKTNAGPSTASFAKCANDFAQDDIVWGWCRRTGKGKDNCRSLRDDNKRADNREGNSNRTSCGNSKSESDHWLWFLVSGDLAEFGVVRDVSFGWDAVVLCTVGGCPLRGFVGDWAGLGGDGGAEF